MNASHLPPSHIHRFGGGKCNSCREPFHIPVSHETITTGTTNFRCENVAEVVAKSNDWAWLDQSKTTPALLQDTAKKTAEQQQGNILEGNKPVQMRWDGETLVGQ